MVQQQMPTRRAGNIHVVGGNRLYAFDLNTTGNSFHIPPGDFGVIIDPGSDDRSIKNVSSAAGIPGRFDHVSPRGTFLKQSVAGVVNGNLGISIWIVPRDWATDIEVHIYPAI